MARLRNTLSLLFRWAAVLGILAVVHEFGVKYAEQKGWYDNLPSRVELTMQWLAALTEPLWFKLIVTLLTGVSMGMWIESKFRKAATDISRFTDDILTIRSSKRASPDFSLARQFLFIPSGHAVIEAPSNPREGTFIFYYLQGDTPYTLSFAGVYEFVQGRVPNSSVVPRSLTVFRIVAINDGGNFRFFMECVTEISDQQEALIHIHKNT